jgi:hypothetical protein
MTLAPLVRPEIRGAGGKPVELGDWCVVPGCISRAQQRHHLWPKSYLRGQPYEWVELDGRVIPNSVGLCLTHHDAVTIGKAHIRFNEELELFQWWQEDKGGWFSLGMLKGQALLEPQPEHAHPPGEGPCPVCGKPRRPKAMASLPPRKTKTWSILVPDDAEVGADVLDTYIQELAALMGLDPDSPRLLRYHVLAPVLEWVTQERVAFLRDWEEAAHA